jgi:hypothetical protein
LGPTVYVHDLVHSLSKYPSTIVSILHLKPIFLYQFYYHIFKNSELITSIYFKDFYRYLHPNYFLILKIFHFLGNLLFLLIDKSR